MAVVSTPLGSTLRIVVETGVDLQGNPVLKNRNYRNVKPTAVDQDVYDVAALLVDLQKNSLSQIQRIDEEALINQE